MLDYKLLAKLNFRVILYTGIVEVLFTILLCYALAVILGHKPVFLPTISECGEEAPEKYFFRWGILVGGILLVIEAITLHNAKRISQHGFIIGVIAGVCLTGVACVASNEDLTIHMGKTRQTTILDRINIFYSSLCALLLHPGGSDGFADVD